MKIRNNIIFLVQDSYFPTGVEEGEHRAEEEDNRAHKDRAPGIPTKSNLTKYEANYSGSKKNRIRTCHKRTHLKCIPRNPYLIHEK